VSKVSCGIVKFHKRFGKDSHLEPTYIDIEYSQSYKDYIQPVMEYFGSSSIIAGIDKAYLEGTIVSPAFTGGPTTSRRKLVVPLVFTIRGFDKTSGKYIIAPYSIEEIVAKINYKGPSTIEYEGDITRFLAWFLTLSAIYPFTIVRFFKIPYHPGGKEELINLLRSLYGVFGVLLENTLSTLKPLKIDIPCNRADKYYVVYRCQRAFASSVLDPTLLRELCPLGNGLIIDHHVSYLETNNEDVAYYYSAILNYMIYKVKTNNLGAFEHNQFGRPLKAIREAGLEWKALEWQKEIAKLSKCVHREARDIVLKVLGIQYMPPYELIDCGRDEDIKKKLGERVEDILTNLVQQSDNLKKIIETIDGNIKEEILIEALRKNVIKVKDVKQSREKQDANIRRSRKKGSELKSSTSLEKWFKKS